MSQWRVVDLLAFEGTLEARRGRLVINDQDVPLAETSCILIGNHVQLDSSVLNMAAKYDVVLASCDWRGVPIATSIGSAGNTRIGARHQAQAALSAPRRKNAWMQIVKAKIKGQAENLKLVDEAASDAVASLANRVRSGDPSNIEAQAAKAYWRILFSDPQFIRSPGSGTGRNSLLDYGYGVLRAQVIKAVLTAGLIGALGIHHKNRSNAYAIADDLIEPFRPVVDWTVVQMPDDAELSDSGYKHQLVDVLGLSFEGDGGTVNTKITELAQNFGQYVEGDIEKLSVPSWVSCNG